jgi:hypothetical protein
MYAECVAFQLFEFPGCQIKARNFLLDTPYFKHFTIILINIDRSDHQKIQYLFRNQHIIFEDWFYILGITDEYKSFRDISNQASFL